MFEINKFTERLPNVRVDKELMLELVKFKEKSNSSYSLIIRTAIKEFLEKYSE